MIHIKNSQGFSLVEGLLITLILSVVGLGGWYVYNENKEKGTQTTTSKSVIENSNRNSEDKKYLVIEEKDLKMELTAEIEDATYHISKDGYIYLSLKRYEGMKGFEGCTAKGGSVEDGSGLGAISEGKVGDDNFGSPMTESELEGYIEDRGVKLGSTYYWITPASQAACWDFENIPESDSRVQEMIELRSKLVGQGKTISKAN